MSRPRRSDVAATERVTIRLTNDEAAALRALATKEGADASSLIRRLLEEAQQAAWFVDARHSYDVPRVDSTIRNLPAFVYTLHHVPGRREPIAVRRKVVAVFGAYVEVELRGGVLSFSLDNLVEGCARSWGSVRGSVRDPRLEPHVIGYLHVPTVADREEWRRRRAHAFRLLSSVSVWTCWKGFVGRFPCQPARPDGSDCFRRGNVTVRLDQTGYAEFNAFEVAFGLDRAVMALIWTHSDGLWRLDRGLRVFTDQPTEAEAAAECERERNRAKEHERRAREERQAEEARATREAEERRAREAWSSMFEDLTGDARALEELGLRWPCCELDVKRAVKAARAAAHPDRGGSHEAFLRVNELEKRAMAFVRHQQRSA